MKWLVRGALGILAALAFAPLAQAQFHPVHPVHPPPRPMPPIVVPPMRPMPSFPTPPSPSPAPAPTTSPVPARVIPPPDETNSHDDGGDDCENRDGNALNDPDDCEDNASAAAIDSGGALADGPANDSGLPADNSANGSAANIAAEPAPSGWRPSWWMIVLGVGAILLLLGWIGGRGRRR